MRHAGLSLLSLATSCAGGVGDGAGVGIARVFTNEMGSHKSFVSRPLVVADLPAGAHDVELTPLAGTASDGNDFFVVTALEPPRGSSTRSARPSRGRRRAPRPY